MRLFLAATFFLLASVTCKAQWEMQDAHVTADLRGIDYVGGGVAWASGSHGTVLRTEDLGYVWQLCATPPDAKDLDFRGVQAFDNNTAIVMSSGPGDKSRLYKTTDGCQTWKLLFTNTHKEGFWDALTVDRTDGWILGDPVEGRFQVLRFSLRGNSATLEEDCRLVNRVVGFEDTGCHADLAADPARAGAFAASNSSFVVVRDAY